jgi:hypothetical protein
MWMAGLFDGEGSVGIYSKIEKARAVSPAHFVQLQVAMAHKPTLDRFAKEFGVGNVNKRASKVKPQKQMWAWQVSGPVAETVLSMLYPFLFTKRAEASVVLGEFRDLARKSCAGRGARVPADVVAKREECAQKVRALKQYNYQVEIEKPPENNPQAA